MASNSILSAEEIQKVMKVHERFMDLPTKGKELDEYMMKISQRQNWSRPSSIHREVSKTNDSIQDLEIRLKPGRKKHFIIGNLDLGHKN